MNDVITAAEFRSLFPATGKGSKEKNALHQTIIRFAAGRTVHREYLFAPPRKFKFDWAIPALKLAVEYEGLMSSKSGHTTVTGYTSNCEKYNLAQTLGWKVYRFTALNYKDADAVLSVAILQLTTPSDK